VTRDLLSVATRCARGPSSVTAEARRSRAWLLEFIYRTECREGAAGMLRDDIRNRQKHLTRSIAKMTLGDLVDAQKNWSSKAWVKQHWGNATASSASGAAQFMRATLIDLSKELLFRGNQIFDANLQDRLAYHLLKRRGFEAYVAGTASRD
jgi:muramidase (phage lysozyme)